MNKPLAIGVYWMTDEADEIIDIIQRSIMGLSLFCKNSRHVHSSNNTINILRRANFSKPLYERNPVVGI